MHEYKDFESGQIETFNGNRPAVLTPEVGDIEISDIVNHLSKICRFNGACNEFFPVSAHSILVAQLMDEYYYGYKDDVTKDLYLPALLHDAHEAYIGDHTSPLKREIPELRTIAKQWDAVIAKRFGFDPILFEHEAIKEADQGALIIEARALMPSKGSGWGLAEHLVERYSFAYLPPSSKLKRDPGASALQFASELLEAIAS